MWHLCRGYNASIISIQNMFNVCIMGNTGHKSLLPLVRMCFPTLALSY